jgi:hypothetical protein
MARSFHPHAAQALNAEQLYTHRKWRLLLMFSGLLDAHAYLYNGLQAFVIGWILDATGSNWTLVFLLLSASRLISAGVMGLVRA